MSSTRWLWLAVAALLVLVFAGLGVWQVKRLAWKEALIQRVEARVDMAPVPMPGQAEWDSLSPASHEYLRVQATGLLLPLQGLSSLAVTDLGSGYWAMVPLQLESGFMVWINTGFVPERDAPLALPQGPVQVVGLLRLSEPEGGFLRTNEPDLNRWYSRDVQVFSAAKGMKAQQVAPYFVDAFELRPVRTALHTQEKPQAMGQQDPVPGLTVLRFHNNHLVYALTWFAMAALTLIVAARTWFAARYSDKTPTGLLHSLTSSSNRQ
ncbi:MAG: SURF1 family protein [Limnobacter sp.]|nr:SURF1 family protein [Limnobacter sp.]